MELVPFHAEWVGSQTKLDLKALYRRPSTEGVTLTGPLPLRRHMDWVRKGYEYVSLASWEDVSLVSNTLGAEGVDASKLRKSYKMTAPFGFDIEQYIKTDAERASAYRTALQAKVDKYGVEAVTEIMRQSDKDFVMPADIKAPAKVGK